LTLDTRVPFEREDEESSDGSAFDVMVVDHGEDDEDMEIAPPLQLDPDRPDPLAGIDFDDDEESMAVRLASPFQLTGAFTAAKPRVLPEPDDDAPAMVLPSDRLHIELDDDDDDPLFKPKPAPAQSSVRAPIREPVRESPRRAPQQPLRTLPFLDDDDMFSIDTDSIELATPTPPPPPTDRPGFDQKLTDHSNSRIVIEILDDEAWPEDIEDKD
jgi:hypothetical protein